MPTGVYKRTKPVWNKGKKLSNAHRKALSAAWCYDKHFNERVNRKRRASLKGRVVTKKTRERISKSLTGKKLSKEHKESCRKATLKRVQLGWVPPWLGKPQSDEHRLKNRLASLGRNTEEKHWNWKGGITELNHAIRTSDRYDQWRKEVFKRDNYTCQKCRQVGGKLEAHHIKNLARLIKENNIKTLKQAVECERLWEAENGVTYCKECHFVVDNWRKRRMKK